MKRIMAKFVITDPGKKHLTCLTESWTGRPVYSVWMCTRNSRKMLLLLLQNNKRERVWQSFRNAEQLIMCAFAL